MQRKGLWAALSLIAATAALAACGNQAEFAAGQKAEHENKRTLAGPSADATVANGAAGGNSGSERSFAPGEDPTDGDREPPTEAPTTPDLPGDDGHQGNDTPDLPGDDGTTMTREMTFPTSRDVDGSVTQKLDAAYVDQNLTLHSVEIDKLKSVPQQPRPAVVDEFEQGVGDTDIAEAFAGYSDRLLDVLLVLDNGSSMREEAPNYAAKLAPVLDRIAGTDWQIGVVTTDPNDTCLRKLIKKGDLDTTTALKTAVTVGTSGSNNPRSLLQAVRSLSGTCLTAPWIRAASQLEVVVVSDKDNCGDGTLCSGKDYALESYLTNYLAGIRVVGKTARVHGVFMPTDVVSCDCPTATAPGRLYTKLVADTKGAAGSICAQDYKPVLDALGTGVESALRTRFVLKTAPASSTLKVYVDGVLQTTGYTLLGNILELAAPLGDGHQLQVVYRATVTTPVTSFKLRYAPLAGSVKVTVDGTAAAPGSYAVDAAVPAVVFTTAPAARAKISISYTRDVPLATQFKLDDAPVAGSLMVKVDGQETKDFTYDAATGLVTFAQAPAEGAVLSFYYKVLGAGVLTYPAALGQTAPAGLTLFDAVTKVQLAFTYTAGQLTIGAADFKDGRQLTLRYPNSTRDQLTVLLPQDPLAGSVTAKAGGMPCASAPVVQGRTVMLDGCGFAADQTEVTVTYRYTQFYRDFVFNAPNLPAPGDFQIWTVWVNDALRTDYTRSGNIVSFAQALPANGTVRVRLLQRMP